MLKIFSTQISGLFKKMIENEAFEMEDAGRLLAQAAVGDGSVFIHGFGEMQGVTAEALDGAEPFPKVKRYELETISREDRFLIFSRHSDDSEALMLAKQLKEKDIPFVAVSTSVPSEEDSLLELADVHIDLRIQRGLIPDETGNRYGYPTLIAALFAYYGIKFTLEEIIKEYEDEE
ncbi:DUF2529 domain-containing protein [Peribacillus simplex]|uniref:DUF2529 domain-containing protein n=2 Tax=Peribacillus TaxID=2675229 RepID=A0AA90P0Z7_9BACI|nr:MULTISPECIES: DUF2529 domain-containing protein [Peribacillus]MDP1418498.1 DUF2529 domain-containing protein [Peribacillus simplex]MDP1451524.1 DUF2529 domain-containing protein [Peribacillus frigoritolerans]